MMLFNLFKCQSKRRRRGPLPLYAMTFGLLMMQSALVSAQTTPTPAIAFEQAFVQKFKNLMTGLNNSDCIGPARSNRVAFLGLPPQNIHLGEFVRKTLNTKALERLNTELGFAFRFDATQNLSLAAKLGDNSPTGQAQLNETINALLKTSPYVLSMQTMRPRKDAVQIKIDLLARGKEGVTYCSKSAQLFVLLSNYTIIDAAHIDSRENRSFIQSKYVYPFILKQFFTDIISFKRLRVINEFALAGSCELSNSAARQFRASYFDFRRSAAQGFNTNRKDWPRLRLEKSADKPSPSTLKVEKGDGILVLRYALSGIDRDVVDVSLELFSNGDVINSTHLSMLINPLSVAGCNAPSRDPLVTLINQANPKGLDFDVRSVKEKFLIGKDKIGFKITANGPLHFHCLSIGADGTSRLAFPWKKDQLDKPWAAGEQRTYPDDFGLSSLILQQEARELFGCYASPTRLPAKLEKRWLEAHPFNSTSGNQGVLSFEETQQFLKWLDATPNTGSAFTWLISTR